MIIIQSPTPKRLDSKSFYENLNFSKTASDTHSIYSDGHVMIEINAERTARHEIKIFSQSIDLEKIRKHAAVLDTKNGSIVTDFTGVWIRILDMEQKAFYPATDERTSMLGNYAGISIETPDMGHSVHLWQLLGFKISMGKVEQGWVTLKNDEDDTISLMAPFMCPHLFFNPSLTFFNGKNNPQIIDNVRKSGVTIAEEITHFNDQGIVDNVILCDPGGLGIFVFND